MKVNDSYKKMECEKCGWLSYDDSSLGYHSLMHVFVEESQARMIYQVESNSQKTMTKLKGGY